MQFDFTRRGWPGREWVVVSTHPPLDERIARLNAGMDKYQDRISLVKLPGRFGKSVRGVTAVK